MEWIIVILICIGCFEWHRYKKSGKKHFFYIGYDIDNYSDAYMGIKLRRPRI